MCISDVIVLALFVQAVLILLSSIIGYFVLGNRGSAYGYILFNVLAILFSILLLPGIFGGG